MNDAGVNGLREVKGGDDVPSCASRLAEVEVTGGGGAVWCAAGGRAAQPMPRSRGGGGGAAVQTEEVLVIVILILASLLIIFFLHHHQVEDEGYSREIMYLPPGVRSEHDAMHQKGPCPQSSA